MLGEVVAACAVAVAALMLAAWLASLVLGDVSIVDPLWGPAFVLVAAVAAVAGSGDSARRVLLLVLTGVWGLRLGLYLTMRKLRDRREDRRYAQMRAKYARFELWSLVMVFGLQGLLVLVVSLPLSAAARCSEPLNGWIAPGLALWAVGLFFEAVGDEQLRRFKADPGNRGAVMDRGLWRYTRHPNYFGDFCVWWGLWLVALPAGGTWWTFAGPLVMSVLLIRVSGKALLERDLAARRPGYAEYVRRTSGFLPRPPRD